jgi:predicted aspartyl protease
MIHAASPARIWALSLAVPLLLGASPLPAPTPAPPAASTPLPTADSLAIDPVTGEVIDPFIQPFDLDATRRMAVDVMVGEQGPFSFLVDTGAERTVISRELADRLNLTPGAKLRLATIGSAAMVPSFRVAMLQMTDLRLAAFDAPAFFGRHIGAAGLVGVDMLENRRILIDFRKESMAVLETRVRARPIIRDDDAIIVTARNMAGRLILSDARLEGKRIDVIIDTGAQSSVGNPALQKLVAKRRANGMPFFPVTLGAVTGEEVPAMRTTINHIVITGLTVNNLPVNFADSQAFRALGLTERPALLLGMDSLSLFDRVEIDFPNRRVIFDLPSGAQREPGRRFAAAEQGQGG